MPDAPRPAATVLVLRERTQGVETLMTRRHPEMAFMGGAWVFPGGSVEAADGEGALAIRNAACRETLEEAGIRIAERDLLPWGRWITPAHAGARARYDTHFFLTAMPPDEAPAVDGREAVEHRWLPVAEARQSGEPWLAPPTLWSLLDLQAALIRHGGLAALLAAEAMRTVWPIVPRLLRRDGEASFVLLPWDPDYASAPGGGEPWDDATADLAGLPSRFALPAGRGPGRRAR